MTSQKSMSNVRWFVKGNMQRERPCIFWPPPQGGPKERRPATARWPAATARRPARRRPAPGRSPKPMFILTIF